MKAGQWSNEQIVALLQEAARAEKPVSTLCREKGLITPSTSSNASDFDEAALKARRSARSR